MNKTYLTQLDELSVKIYKGKLSFLWLEQLLLLTHPWMIEIQILTSDQLHALLKLSVKWCKNLNSCNLYEGDFRSSFVVMHQERIKQWLSLRRGKVQNVLGQRDWPGFVQSHSAFNINHLTKEDLPAPSHVRDKEHFNDLAMDAGRFGVHSAKNRENQSFYLWWFKSKIISQLLMYPISW